MTNLAALKKASQDHSVLRQKIANDQSFYDAVQQATTSGLQSQAARNAGLIGLTGLGVGAGSRGLLGLMQLISRNVSKPKPSLPAPVHVDLVGHGQEEEEEEKMSGVADFLEGGNAKTVGGVPWAMPAGVAAGAGGLYGGWSLMDYLLDKRRKSETESELAKAKETYEQALMDSSKRASDNSLGRDLDELYDELEKQALFDSDTAGKLVGAYGVAAGGAGVLSSIIAYKWAKKRQRKVLLAKAQEKRRRARFALQPSSLYARPSPMRRSPEPIEVQDPMQAAPSSDETEDQLEL